MGNNFVDNSPLEFGKHKGLSPNEIAEIDPPYLVWLYDNLDEKFVTKALRDACEDMAYDEWPDNEYDDFGYW